MKFNEFNIPKIHSGLNTFGELNNARERNVNEKVNTEWIE